MSVRVVACSLFGLPVSTRMPFRYGMATMTAAPHLFVRVAVETEHGRADGVASDNLPPKWFTKDPATSYGSDLRDMLAVIEAATDHALAVGTAPTVFELWRRMYRAQEDWATNRDFPRLLWAFGVSLVERAVIDAYCRVSGTSFGAAVRANTFGIRLGQVHPALAGWEPAQLLPAAPSASIAVRHTVGLTDPLTDAEIPRGERVDDGLPQSLYASVEHYGLTHVKIKLSGQQEVDLSRLRDIDALLSDREPEWCCTLDGNEQFTDVGDFADFWDAFRADAGLAAFRRRVLFVEQPLHRARALAPDVGTALSGWPDPPTLIIDESGDGPDSLIRALELGYAGTSHKNCKGVFHGVANACLIRHLAETQRRDLVLSGEDLTNLGPVALHQDLAVMATLGLEHAERNGHHYFRGASAFPARTNEHLLRHHDDLYRRHPDGFATLDVTGGRIRLDSVNRAPFGSSYLPEPIDFTAVGDWDLDRFT